MKPRTGAYQLMGRYARMKRVKGTGRSIIAMENSTAGGQVHTGTDRQLIGGRRR